MVSSASGAARSQKAQSWKGPNTIDTRERAWQKRQKTRRDMERRTRRSASTIGGAAPDSIIGRTAADRAGARPGARPYQSAHQAGWRGAPSRRPHHDNKRSSHFSTKGETLPSTKPANANNALRA